MKQVAGQVGVRKRPANIKAPNAQRFRIGSGAPLPAIAADSAWSSWRPAEPAPPSIAGERPPVPATAAPRSPTPACPAPTRDLGDVGGGPEKVSG